MTTFVHIADERTANSIRRGGLALSRSRWRKIETEISKAGVFATPVTSNYLVTHQWVRELKRRGFRTAVGIYFRIADDELIWCGRHNQPKQMIAAAVAADWLGREQMMGFEAVIPRSISASEIIAIRPLSQVMGWRFFPEAKGRHPFCGCKYCVGGQIKSRRFQAQWEAG